MEQYSHILEDNMSILITDAQGVYLPQVFASAYGDHPELVGADADDIATLIAGPEHEWYWEAWQNICDNATLSGKSLYQQGDLWLVDYDAIDAACFEADIDSTLLWEQCGPM